MLESVIVCLDEFLLEDVYRSDTMIAYGDLMVRGCTRCNEDEDQCVSRYAGKWCLVTEAILL